jgi:hypothetical protein
LGDTRRCNRKKVAFQLLNQFALYMRKTMKLKLAAILCAIASSAFAQSGIRQFQIVSDNLQFPAPVNVEWMQGESPQFVITAKQGNFYVGFSNGASVVLKAWAGNITTQLYANKTGTVDTAKQGKATVELLASEANFAPTGRYNYAVGVYDGTNYMGIIAQGVATVRGHPFGNNIGYVGTTSPFPYVPTNDANFLGAITGAYIAGQSGTGNVTKAGRSLALTYPAGGGGVGTFTNVTIGTNRYTTQVEIQVESNIVLRASGGTNYFGLANTLAGNFTFNGAINANDNIEIANTKHLRFQDGGGTNTVHLAATAGRLIVTGAVDVVTGQAVPFTVNGIAPLYVQSETNAEARLASNAWSVADSTTNYVRRTGDTMSGVLLSSEYIQVTKDSGQIFGRDVSGSNQISVTALGTFGAMLITKHHNSAGTRGITFLADGSGLLASIVTNSILAYPAVGFQNSHLGAMASVSTTGTISGSIVYGTQNFIGNGAGLTNVTADSLNNNAAQSLLTNNLVILGTAPVTVTTTTGGNITTATVSLATSGTLPVMDGRNLTNLPSAFPLSANGNANNFSITNLASVNIFAGVNNGTNVYFTMTANPTTRVVFINFSP